MRHRDLGAQVPSTCIVADPSAGWLGPVAEQLHGAQGPAVCREAGTGAEAHVVKGGRQENKTQVQAASITHLDYKLMKGTAMENSYYFPYSYHNVI